jgi:hypothetical protein
VFDGDLITELQPIIADHGTGHAAAFAAITDPLAGLAPGGYLRATRRDAANGFEQRLLDASDRAYRLIIDVLRISSPPRAPSAPWPSPPCGSWMTPTASWPSAASYRRSPSPNAMPFIAAQASLVTSASSSGLLMQYVTGSMCRWAG